MSTERKVVSLDLSRKLAEAGFPQECVFAWYQLGEFASETRTLTVEHAHLFPLWNRICAAPLLSEIMEHELMRFCEVKCCGFHWRAMTGPGIDELRDAATGPDAAAALWLALRGEK